MYEKNCSEKVEMKVPSRKMGEERGNGEKNFRWKIRVKTGKLR